MEACNSKQIIIEMNFFLKKEKNPPKEKKNIYNQIELQ